VLASLQNLIAYLRLSTACPAMAAVRTASTYRTGATKNSFGLENGLTDCIIDRRLCANCGDTQRTATDREKRLKRPFVTTKAR
jgi:hypothetical protein